MEGNNGKDQREEWVIFEEKCECEKSDGKMENEGRIKGDKSKKKIK